MAATTSAAVRRGSPAHEVVDHEGGVAPDAVDEVGAAEVLEALAEHVEPGDRRGAAHAMLSLAAASHDLFDKPAPESLMTIHRCVHEALALGDASLQARAQRYAVVQEGERPAEDPQAILHQVETVAGELQRLIFAINRANLQHDIGTGESLTAALSRRDSLALRHRILQSVVDVCAKPPDRYGVKEIRWVTTVDVAGLQDQVDRLAKDIRELNAAIQEAGWQVELEQ